MNENRKQILEAGLRGEEVLLKGIVIPGELDALFKMTSILLATDQELDFTIERNAKGETKRTRELAFSIPENLAPGTYKLAIYVNDIQNAEWPLQIAI